MKRVLSLLLLLPLLALAQDAPPAITFDRAINEVGRLQLQLSATQDYVQLLSAKIIKLEAEILELKKTK